MNTMNITKVISGLNNTNDADLIGIAESLTKRRALVKSNALKALKESKRPLEVAHLIAKASQGDHLAVGRLREAVSTSDFPELFAMVTQTGMLSHYADLPQQWPAFSMRQIVPNFRPARLMRWDTAMEQLPANNGGHERHVRALPRIPELTEYPTFSLTAESQEYFVNKYGARFPFSWEAFLNDEMGVITQLPGEMARWARDTEDLLTTGVLAVSTGPNPDFFSTGFDFGNQVPAGTGNYVPGNPPLSIESLEQAIQYIRMRQVGGRSVQVPNFVLVVPPALALTAQEIVSATTYLRVTVDENGNELRYNVPSPVAGQFSIQVNEWLPLIDQSENVATTWYVVPAGGRTQRGPAIVTAFLRGHEAPELRINGDTGRSVGGGEISPYAGSFSHDDTQFRVRAVIGAAGLDPSPVAVSLGTGDDES